MSIRYKLANWISGGALRATEKMAAEELAAHSVTRHHLRLSWDEVKKMEDDIRAIYNSLEGHKSGTAVRIRRELGKLL